MRKFSLIATVVAFAACVPAHAAETDKVKEWCTAAHMKQMDEKVGQMTDAAKQKDANMHLTMSKDAMKANDMAGCAKHMEEAHKAMGM